MRLLLLQWNLLLHQLLWERLVWLLLEDLLLLLVRGWSESGYLFLLSSHSSRLFLFLSLRFAFARCFFPCLREDAAVWGFLQEKEILSLLVSNTILAQLLCSKHSR
jgi:hypothetical protein